MRGGVRGESKVVTVKHRESPGERIFMPLLGLWVFAGIVYFIVSVLGWWALLVAAVLILVVVAASSSG